MADLDSPGPGFSHEDSREIFSERPGFHTLCLGCLLTTQLGSARGKRRSQVPWELQDGGDQFSSRQGTCTYGNVLPAFQLQTEKHVSFPSRRAENQTAW